MIDSGLVGKELDCVILICNASVVLSQMFSGGPDLRDADLGASQKQKEGKKGWLGKRLKTG